MPRRSFDPGSRLPLMDAQRAVSLVRSRATQWKLDPKRIVEEGYDRLGSRYLDWTASHAPGVRQPAGPDVFPVPHRGRRRLMPHDDQAATEEPR